MAQGSFLLGWKDGRENGELTVKNALLQRRLDATDGQTLGSADILQLFVENAFDATRCSFQIRHGARQQHSFESVAGILTMGVHIDA